MVMTKLSTSLPAVVPTSTDSLAKLTSALGVPRDALPSSESIERAWQQLPRLLDQIPPEYRTEHHLRMCVAVANGLFDAAINYVWNATVLRLRDRVRAFGIHIVPSITRKEFDEGTLAGLKDADLINLCLRLNLISEDAFFFLDQCREVRNNFSSAHPAMGALDDLEVLTFLKRCVDAAMTETRDLRGVHLPTMLDAIKNSRFTPEQEEEWARRLRDTHDSQRETAIGMLHGIYCDPSSNEEARLNALDVCRTLSPEFTPATKSTIINRHSDYVASGDEERRSASQEFFQKAGLLALLSHPERHALFSNAAARLLSVHNGWDNFHNEPPFAERLMELSGQTAVPATAQKEFVLAVVTCAIGNPYGVSRAAMPSYHAMVRNFSPQEIAYMLAAPTVEPSVIRTRINAHPKCRERFRKLVQLLDPASIPAAARPQYQRWMEN